MMLFSINPVISYLTVDVAGNCGNSGIALANKETAGISGNA
jgi:hypothetical protein